MVERFFCLLFFYVVNDVTAFLHSTRASMGKLGSRSQFLIYNSQLNYDPFESDANIQAMVITELSFVKNLNSTIIKLELASMGYNSKGFVDKSELEKVLARKRVKNNLSVIQAKKLDARIKEERADLIEDEIERIEVSKMTEISIIYELQSLKVKVNVSGDLVHQLALARLGINTMPSVSEADGQLLTAEDSVSVFNDTMTDLKGVYNRLTQNLEAIIPVPSISVSFKNDSANDPKQMAIDRLAAVQEFTRNIGMTEIEQKAQKVLSQNEKKGYYSKDIVGSEASLSTEPEIIEALAAASKFRTFDEIVHWARHTSRAELAQLLIYRNEYVPKYAPRSALAAILADSLLVSRINDEIDRDQFFEESSGSTPEAPSYDSKDLTQIGKDQVFPASVPFRPRPTGNKVFKDVEKKTRGKRYTQSDQMSSFFFEKELLQKARDTFSNAVKSVINTETFNDVTNGATRKSFKNFLNRLILLGCKSAVTIAKWAGDDIMSPSEVLFITTAYSVLFKKGIWTFLGSFLLIRLFREIMFARSTFVDRKEMSQTSQ